jgi:hypothetical protein
MVDRPSYFARFEVFGGVKSFGSSWDDLSSIADSSAVASAEAEGRKNIRRLTPQCFTQRVEDNAFHQCLSTRPRTTVPVNTRKNRKNFPCTRPGKSTKSSSNVQPANAVIVNTRKVKRADRDRFCRSPEGSLYENNTSEHWKH